MKKAVARPPFLFYTHNKEEKLFYFFTYQTVTEAG
jgi:hypothetical protein